MEKEKIIEHCSHNFVYSHKDKDYVENMIYKVVDVVICTMCGEVRRD